MSNFTSNTTTDDSLSESLLPNSEKQYEDTKVSALFLDPVAVPPELNETQPNDTVEDATSWERGEKQPSRCRDVPFAILFHAQCSAVIALAIVTGIPTLTKYFRDNDPSIVTTTTNDDNYGSWSIYVPILIAFGSTSVLMSLSLMILIHKAKAFIQCSILFNILFPLVVAAIAFGNGNIVLGVSSLSLSGFVVLWWCCCSVKKRLPYAVANLHAGANATKANGGIFIFAYFWVVLFMAWCLLWMVLLSSTIINGFDADDTCDSYDGTDCVESMSSSSQVYVILLVLSFYWTQQVSKNVIHTTVAGVVGTWYFDPTDANRFFSTSIWSSTFRTLTFSFGSVCLGSFLCAILSTLKFIMHNLRSNARRGSAVEGILFCVLDCILSLMQDLMNYFNKWAYIYVGLYGYHYMEAGKKVFKLFQQRGWSVIINDDLIGTALSFMSSTIGLFCGIILYIVYGSQPLFWLGFLIGTFFSLTMMSVIDSASSTVVVCFSEAPQELEMNHPKHSAEMKEAWQSVYELSF